MHPDSGKSKSGALVLCEHKNMTGVREQSRARTTAAILAAARGEIAAHGGGGCPWGRRRERGPGRRPLRSTPSTADRNARSHQCWPLLILVLHADSRCRTAPGIRHFAPAVLNGSAAIQSLLGTRWGFNSVPEGDLNSPTPLPRRGSRVGDRRAHEPAESGTTRCPIRSVAQACYSTVP